MGRYGVPGENENALDSGLFMARSTAIHVSPPSGQDTRGCQCQHGTVRDSITARAAQGEWHRPETGVHPYSSELWHDTT